MKILIASTNPVKIAAAKTAFCRYFTNIGVKGRKTASDVPDQPIGENEVFSGAKNRAKNLAQKEKADFYVGIEGGMMHLYGRRFGFGCMCVMDKNNKMGFGTSPWFELPDSVSRRMFKGEELGLIMDDIMNEKNTKQKGGAIGFLTNGVMDRKDLYVQGLIVALVPFIKKELY